MKNSKHVINVGTTVSHDMVLPYMTKNKLLYFPVTNLSDVFYGVLFWIKMIWLRSHSTHTVGLQ